MTFGKIMIRQLKWLFVFFPKRAIKNPRLGMLDLTFGASDALIEKDAAALRSIFSSVETSKETVPQCDVLFLYATLEVGGALQGTERYLRATIRDSGAKIVVVASENPTPPASPERPVYGHANLVITLQRNGNSFSRFFSQLFAKMKEGTTMPRAWVSLAPQFSNQAHVDCPGTICLFELGGLRFK